MPSSHLILPQDRDQRYGFWRKAVSRSLQWVESSSEGDDEAAPKSTSRSKKWLLAGGGLVAAGLVVALVLRSRTPSYVQLK